MHLLFTFSKSLTLTSPQFSWIKHSGEERIFLFFFPLAICFTLYTRVQDRRIMMALRNSSFGSDATDKFGILPNNKRAVLNCDYLLRSPSASDLHSHIQLAWALRSPWTCWAALAHASSPRLAPEKLRMHKQSVCCPRQPQCGHISKAAPWIINNTLQLLMLAPGYTKPDWILAFCGNSIITVYGCVWGGAVFFQSLLFQGFGEI